ncbi:glycine-rich protein 23 isoform X1 [Nasonia vitripennis]|uniref:Uncharacterized protein n=1 Tax=Nasonia vitripennis TaxID=7425 RepID=A0A7M7G354_NASVI|nr:glycine-rich protein 23 isoform X1 [Nasonia vitripennis]
MLSEEEGKKGGRDESPPPLLWQLLSSYKRLPIHPESSHYNRTKSSVKMYLKYWILLAALLAVAYAAIEPLDLVAEESQEHPAGQHVRQKRFLLLKKAILAKKALAIGGAVGLGVGLVKAKHFGGGFGGGYGGGHGGGWQKPIIVHAYPASHSSGWSSGGGGGWPSGGGGGGGWSGASSNAWAGSSSW